MTMQTFALTPARIGKYKAGILKSAEPQEVLGKIGRQVELPKNQSDTYIARRFLPFGATSTNQNTINRFFQDGNGDRSAAITTAHLVQEGITPQPDSITPVDVQVIIQQYSCLYGFTDKTFNLFEDDIPGQQKMQVATRMTFVNEQIIYGALKACTNVYYGGTGTSMSTVNGNISLNMIRRIVQNLQANHAMPITSMLSASIKFDTEPVSLGYLVYVHTDMEPDIRDLPGFTPTEKYASGSPMEGEIGKCERFRFIGHPDIPPLQNAGAAVVSAPGMYSTSGANVDVYPIIVCAQDAWSQVSVRGLSALDPTFLPPGQKSKSDPHGQRGYAGTIWWKAVLIENNGWMAVANVARKNLPN